MKLFFATQEHALKSAHAQILYYIFYLVVNNYLSAAVIHYFTPSLRFTSFWIAGSLAISQSPGQVVSANILW